MSSAQEKKRLREARNNESAKKSRERKTMLKAHLTAEKARLLESNALMRAQLDNLMSADGSSGAGSSSAPRPGGSSSRAGPSRAGPSSGGEEMLQLSDSMSKLFGGRKEISSRAAVDLLDRVLSGGQGKGPPVDGDLVNRWGAAQARAPVVPKPNYYNSAAEAANHAKEIQAKKKAASERKKAAAAAKKARKR